MPTLPRPRALRTASLIASAELLRSPRPTTGKSVNRNRARSSFSQLPAAAGWQTDAWAFYRRCGELRQGVRWLANACSRATLKLGTVDPRGDGTPVPVDDQALIDRYLTSWAGGADGQAELLAQMAIHATVVGEWYLVAYAHPDTGTEVWSIASRAQLQTTGSGEDAPFKLQIDEQRYVELAQGESFVSRIWRPDPERSWQADSPVQPLLPDLRILCGLTAHVNATIDSRLAGNGILAVPLEASLTGAETVPVNDADGNPREDTDEFMDELIENMVPAITDRDRASAVVPIVLRAKGEDIKNIQHIDISSKFDERSSELLAQAQRKLAIGMDVPPTAILGSEEANHWTSWQISEEAVDLHVIPVLRLFTQPVTDRYLRPLMEDDGIQDASRYVIYADTTELTLRPDQSDDAIQLYDRGELSGEALRREIGFGDGDKPSDEERTRRALWKLAENPQMAQQILSQALGIDLGPSTPAPGSGGLGAGPSAAGAGAGQRQAPAADTGRGAEPRALPAQRSDTGMALTAAADMAVRRALEVAGKRMTPGRTSTDTTIPAWQVHTTCQSFTDMARLLDGAWTHLAACPYASAEAIAAVDRYTRHLITSRQAHDVAMLTRHLRDAGVLR
ncbi:hypothetical protein AB0J38_14335 [Streptomyces sp. NPDC050095]|uniref:hypothetical protein n=1 Tax=unclassified Streptomyces TaxID=2593676 RepID=UPI00343F5F52